jgi:hypothetical protein
MADAKKGNVQLPRVLATRAKAKIPASDTEKGSAIPRPNPLIMNQSVRVLRDSGRVTEAIRKLAQVDGTVSTAVFSYVQLAMSGSDVTAYSTVDHSFSPDGTLLARAVMASMDTLYDYTKGYSDKQTMEALVETALREVVLTGAVAGELVLDKAHLPDRISIVPAETLKWISNGDGTKYPAQDGDDGDIPLNLATFWVAESHKDADKVYAASMMEAAINNAYYYLEFIEDLRKVTRRSGHSRLVVLLDTEKITGMATPEQKADPAKMKSFMEGVREDVETVVNSMEPEDCLVSYDSIEVDLKSSESVKSDYPDLMKAISGILALSLKSHPSILGMRLEGSQSLSNTESLVFLKNATAIQRPVQDVMSRALTLACRLYGADVYVKFKFRPINLRPETELEAFITMREQRILNRLNFGLISDEKAALELGIWPLPAGYKNLSGTMFMSAKSTNRADEASPNADPQGRALQPDTPSKGGGSSQ